MMSIGEFTTRGGAKAVVAAGDGLAVWFGHIGGRNMTWNAKGQVIPDNVSSTSDDRIGAKKSRDDIVWA